ncbi:MAG: hypothetical protein M3457_13775 [Chloroflexota bacterium]|nr:hypothetical protein [Chloroflexota bacterium]
MSSATPGLDPATRRLWWYAILFLFPVTMFAVAYPLHASSGQLVDIGKLAQYRPAALVAYVLGVATMFVLYLLAIRAARAATGLSAVIPVASGGVIYAVVMAAMYPVNAIDLFIYAVRSRIFTTHGQNPLAVPPSSFPDDPLMTFSSAEWGVTVSPYGPLWNLIAAPITALAGDNLLAALYGFKALAVVSVIAGAYLIAQTLRTTGLPVAAGVLIYLWNPLVLWEGIGNGHNDTVMMVPVLAAVLAWARGWDRYVLPLLVTAACIKYVALLALPVAAVALWRRHQSGWDRVKIFSFSAVVSVAVAVVSAAPFFDVTAIWLSLSQQGSIFLTSPAAVAVTVLDDVVADGMARPLVSMIGVGLMAAFLCVQLIRVWRQPDRFPRALFETLFVFLLIATWNFRVWYLIWPVALAALLSIGWPAWRAIAWTAGGLAGYALFIWVWHWWEVDFPTIQAIGVAILTGPAIVMTAAELVQYVRRRRAPAPPHPARR